MLETETTGADTSPGFTIEDLAGALGSETTTQDDGTTALATAQPTKEAASGEQNADQVPLEAPKHWAQADKTLFAGAPREIQQRWIAREREQQQGLDAKFQEIAGFRRERESLDELFRPLDRDLTLQGLNRVGFIKTLLEGHRYLQESPRDAVLWFCNQFGVDPMTLAQQAQPIDPQVSKFTTEIQQLKSQLNGVVSETQQQKQHQVLSQIKSFENEKGPDGKPLRPYFGEVMEEVSIALNAMPPGQKDLNAAYQKAIRMSDSVWEKVQAEKAKAETDARMQDVNKAKRAAVGSESRVTGSAKPKSLEQELLDAGLSSWGN